MVDRLFEELPSDLTFEDNNSNVVLFSNHQGYPIIAVNGRGDEEVHQIYPVQTKQDSIGNTIKKYAGKLNVIKGY